MGDAEGVTGPLADGLSACGYRTCVLVPGEQNRWLGDARAEFALGDESVLEELRPMLCGRENDAVGGVISLLGLTDLGRHAELPTADQVRRLSDGVFLLFKALHEDLVGVCEEGTPRLINVTAMGGRFGLEGSAAEFNGAGMPIAASPLVGFFKGYRGELPDCALTCFDTSAELSHEELVDTLVDEFESDSGGVEIGLAPGRRWRVVTEERPVDTALAGPVAERGDVWLITGGADGVTALVARPLAELGCKLVICGRSPLVDESPDTAALDPGALRGHLITAARDAGEKPVPAEIEKRVQRLLKNRRIAENLALFRSLGGEAEYVSCDVRDDAAFGAAIDGIYERYGRLDGVAHGAGVIYDRLVEGKTPEMFRAVTETKIASALTLARKVRPAGLKRMAFFSSTSARFGNAGQTDYCAGNEFLNKLACRLDAEWPGRIVATGWGPWDYGMLSGELRKAYIDRGIGLLPPELGIRMFAEEMAAPDDGPSEVILSLTLDRIGEVSRGIKTPAGGRPSGL
ncbi:Polyketide synthase PksM [Pseudobythopirellula maris]|uniref:Polyketide synthase PksM n=1 Tax=Pseudobythopirellula maris TaxID=2527991 RepID=A0A5C5ZK28_9BACT|nr:Polyketide synthase PksM [Pseudobythopirellula maris]